MPAVHTHSTLYDLLPDRKCKRYFGTAALLYRCLEFQEVGENGPYYLMVWRTPGKAGGQAGGVAQRDDLILCFWLFGLEYQYSLPFV